MIIIKKKKQKTKTKTTTKIIIKKENYLPITYQTKDFLVFRMGREGRTESLLFKRVPLMKSANAI